VPDSPLDKEPLGPYDSGMETRVSRLEEDMRDMKAAFVRVETGLADLRAAVARIEATISATLPHLATKADLAEKPSKTYMWGILGALLTAYACGLAALAVLK
jgi:hypothetical protein